MVGDTHELMRGDLMLAWLEERPAYCDRGRFHMLTNVPHHRSDADPSPRYYFDLDRGKAETEAYLTAKKIDLTGAQWVLNPGGKR